MYELRKFAALAALGVAVTANAQYQQVNLVSDGALPAAHQDPNLVNPWGLAVGPTTPFWVANNGTGTSTLYRGDGSIVPLVVRVAAPLGTAASGAAKPTGLVYNGGSGFMIKSGNAKGPSKFIFVSEDGNISGWNPDVSANSTVMAVPATTRGAIYKGAAIYVSQTFSRLYVTNFNSGTVEMFDQNFRYVGSFTDRGLPAGFVPFGIANVNGSIVVTFAQRIPGETDDLPGPGSGFVDVFDLNGKMVRRLAAKGTLNSPWGVTRAPDGFGKFSNSLLVGNFGDGRINAFDWASGAFLGQLESSKGNPIEIEGLWALINGNGVNGGDKDKVYFTAGPMEEQHGLFGSLRQSDQPQVTRAVVSPGRTVTRK